MSWRVAYSLDVLLAEVNRAAPNRSKRSDGSIGDPAHSSRESDHNPNPAGVVRARDFTHDPTHGCDAGKLAEAVRRLGMRGHPALGSGAYVIWDRRIASATQDGRPWDWEEYDGVNPHTAHVHVSVARQSAGYDSRRPWGVMETAPKEEDDMQLSDRVNVKGELAGQILGLEDISVDGALGYAAASLLIAQGNQKRLDNLIEDVAALRAQIAATHGGA